jgi:hypothetical protein
MQGPKGGTVRYRLLAVPLLILAAASFAGCSLTSTEFSRDGVYLGAYGLKAYEDFEVTASGSGTDADVGDSDLGAGARLGVRFLDHVAVEVFYESVQGFEVEDNNVSADLDLAQAGVAAKLFPFTGRFQPYLLAGGGAATADIDGAFNADDDGGFLRAGLGLDVYLTANLALFAEANYNHMTGGTEDLDHVDAMLGLMFRF